MDNLKLPNSCHVDALAERSCSGLGWRTPPRFLGLFFYSAALFSIPIVDIVFVRDGEGSALAFAVLLTSVFVIGVLNGLVEGSFVGLALQLTPRYSQAYLTGYALSGIFNVGLRALTKAVLTDSDNGLRISAGIFFCAATLICFVCWATHRFVIMPHSFFVKLSNSGREQEPLLETGAASVESRRFSWKNVEFSEYLETAKKAKLVNFNVFFTTVVSTTIFPGVASDAECQILGNWFGIILVGLLSIANLIPRILPQDWVLTNPTGVTVFAVSYTLTIPLTAASQNDPILVSLCHLVVGFFVGYLLHCCFIMCYELTEGPKEAFREGNLIIFSMIAGMEVGSLFSLLWSALE